MTLTYSMFDKTAYILVRIRAGTLHDVHHNEYEILFPCISGHNSVMMILIIIFMMVKMMTMLMVMLTMMMITKIISLQCWNRAG